MMEVVNTIVLHLHIATTRKGSKQKTRIKIIIIACTMMALKLAPTIIKRVTHITHNSRKNSKQSLNTNKIGKISIIMIIIINSSARLITLLHNKGHNRTRGKICQVANQ